MSSHFLRVTEPLLTNLQKCGRNGLETTGEEVRCESYKKTAAHHH